MTPRTTPRLVRATCLFTLIATGTSCSDSELIPMQVELTRSVSKLPFVVALDQGLYEKYGLDVDVRMEPPDFEGGIRLPSAGLAARTWRLVRRITGQQEEWRPEIRVSGANAAIVRSVTRALFPRRVSIGATDCVVRAHIVASKDIERLEDLRGKRIGVSGGLEGNTGSVALLLAERMGWDPVQDISIMLDGNSMLALRYGLVDAFLANERSYATALQEGYPVLASTADWDEPLAGNSVTVTPEWLAQPRNRETARRFLQATIHGIALFHQDRRLVMDVLARWHGIKDPDYAELIYAAGQSIPRKPYPCYAGIEKTMQRYDSNEMRKHTARDFYDDSLVRELDESGFIDELYASP